MWHFSTLTDLSFQTCGPLGTVELLMLTHSTVPGQKFQFTMKKTRMGQLTSTLPNSAGPPAVGPPAQRSRCDCRPAHARACMHTAHTHSPPGHGKPTLPPMLLRVLCFWWLLVINWITQAVTVSCPLFPAQLSNWLPGLCRPPEGHQWGFSRALNIILLLNGDLVNFRKRDLQNPRTEVLSSLQIFILL